jgi:hypothetical protein
VAALHCTAPLNPIECAKLCTSVIFQKPKVSAERSHAPKIGSSREEEDDRRSMQRTRCNMQRRACNVQDATCNAHDAINVRERSARIEKEEGHLNKQYHVLQLVYSQCCNAGREGERGAEQAVHRAVAAVQGRAAQRSHAVGACQVYAMACSVTPALRLCRCSAILSSPFCSFRPMHRSLCSGSGSGRR